jgi:hypothetical protein
MNNDLKDLAALKQKLSSAKSLFAVDDDDERTDEYVHLHFVGINDGKEVAVDAALYTLRMHHESELFEIAEEQAYKHFPQYKKLHQAGAEVDDKLEEEVGMFMAEVILDLEEEETIKVKEHVDLEVTAELNIGLDVGLNVDSVTDAVIEKFISDFNNDKIQLDPTLYSFETGSFDEDDD